MAVVEADTPSEPRPLSESAAPARDGSMAKARMVGVLGEQALLLPAQVNAALVANDRAKYLMTLLQLARGHADQPDLPTSDLKAERLACGIADDALDRVIKGSRKTGTNAYAIPDVDRLYAMLLDEVQRMLVPFEAQGTTGLAERVRSLQAGDLSPVKDRLPGEVIDRLTSAQREHGDSVHLLVMDLHKELNRLQRHLATETIDGAQVYGLHGEDRPLVAAFMAGVNQTLALKFDHPGLGTTATRNANRLVIQNDIGLTDAHVLVVHVEPPLVTLTYTDVHLDRVLFFQGLLEPFQVHWEDTVSKRVAGLSEEVYHLCVGTFTAAAPARLLSYLTYLGSRLVFLIDWNRARKRLRKFAPRRVCLQVLRWAADHDCGHRGFLALGGEQLLYDALEASGRLPLPPGGQLADVFGPERTAEFLKFTLQTASDGLRAGQSEFLIRDQISAELRHYIETVHQGFLEIAGEHASLIVELALAARDLLLTAGPMADRGLVARMVGRGRQWEHRADELVSRCRTARGRGDAPGPIAELLVTADDVADGLEETLFWISLLPDAVTAGMAAPLNDLADLVLQGAQEYLKAVENARCLDRGSPREQVADFLEAVDRVLTVEHQTDDALRRVQAGILRFTGDFKQWHLLSTIAGRLEEAADALLRSALGLRDYILGEVLRR